MNQVLLEVIKTILTLSIPFIKQLIDSEVVPRVKRVAYEKIDHRVDDLIEDLAQNAGKIKDEKNDIKRLAYLEGTQLGLNTIRAIADKLTKAADEIEKELNS